MIVTEIDHGLVLAANEPGYVRSPGLHMSDIYGSLFKKLDPKRYDKKTAAGEEQPFDLTIMEEGMAFESWLEPQLRLRLIGERPGEFRTIPDGVIYSPDYLFIEGDEMILGEFKRTKYSLRGMPFSEKADKWICQMKAYCYHLAIVRARLYVLFVNGDYSYKSPGGDEQIKCWEFVFTQVELDRNWRMLLRHAIKEGMIIDGNS